MSFILDALRKSESARRRSEAPDLFATMPSTSEPPLARPVWPLWAVGIVGTLSLLMALWLFSQRKPAPEPTPAASGTTVETALEADTEADPPTFPPMPVATHTPSPARNVAAAEPPVPPNALPADNSSSPVPAHTPENANLPPTLPEPQNAPPPVPPTLPIVPPAGDQLLALADLDPAMRKQLPPLKLSMHLWNETASQRFVILDGQRLKEGDALGEIVIERISRDGAVLAWRGSRLKIELH